MITPFESQLRLWHRTQSIRIAREYQRARRQQFQQEYDQAFKQRQLRAGATYARQVAKRLEDERQAQRLERGVISAMMSEGRHAQGTTN